MADIPQFEVPPQMRALAEAGVGQARSAFDGFMSLAKRSTEAMRGMAGPMAPGAEIYTRGLDYAEQNVHAAFDHAEKLSRATNFQEVLQLQAEFVRGQFEAMQEQAKAFGGMAQGAVQEGVERTRSAMQQGAAQTRSVMDQAQD